MKPTQYSLTDIRQAVAAGILSEESFLALERFLTDQPNDPVETEKFSLFRGMNDIFLALGTFVLAVGWFVLWGQLSQTPFFWAAPLIAMGGFLMLAEYVAGKLKSSLSSMITMATLGATFVAYVLALYLLVIGFGAQSADLEFIADKTENLTIALVLAALCGFGFQVLFFLRYRLPICFALIAGALLLVFWAGLRALFGEAFVDDNLNFLLTLTGLVLLVLAVWIDTKDPLRVNGWAECAFWLYVMGTPMTVHSFLAMFDLALWAVVPVILVAMVFALVLDRRSPIISGLIYVGYLVNAGFNDAEMDSAMSFAIVCFVVGGLVLAFGFGWQTARLWVMSPFETQSWRRYLPPT